MTLDQIAIKHGTDKSSEIHDYCQVYDRLLEPLRSEPINLLEIGVSFGASVRMWLEYFDRATIHGVEITRQDDVLDPRFVFLQGDQSKPEFWNRPDSGWNPLTVVVDDGSHYAAAVLTTFGALWPQLVPGGLYFVEDVFCWFFYTIWDTEGHGKHWLASLLSDVNQGGKFFHGNPGNVPADQTLTQIESEIEWLEFHKGLVVIKKREGQPPLL